MGDERPEKFVTNQIFIIVFQLVIAVTVTILGALSIDGEGGNFPVPYFFFGFILAVFHILSTLPKLIIVLKIENKKSGGLTKKKIVDVLSKRGCARIVWPRIHILGAIYCIPATITIGVSGINCYVKNNNYYNEDIPQLNHTEIVLNNCYYDFEADTASAYRGMAIGLLVCHILSFILLLFTAFPENAAKEIKEDRAVRPAPPAASTSSAATTATHTAQPAAPPSKYEMELQARVQALEEREKALRHRVEQAERAINGQISTITASAPPPAQVPPPPSYDEMMAGSETGFNNQQYFQLSTMQPLSNVGTLPAIDGQQNASRT